MAPLRAWAPPKPAADAARLPAARSSRPAGPDRLAEPAPPFEFAAVPLHAPSEQAADRAADLALHRRSPAAAEAARAAPAPHAGPVPDALREALGTAGQPLDPATRAFMEPRFGHDFGRVRVHADGAAARSAAALGAEAFAAGPHVAFARGRYAPATTAGRRLIAHELAHIVQQEGRPPRLALQPARDRPAPGTALADEVLDLDRNGRQVLVAREVGDARGYDGRWQAAAVARMFRADPAAVARDKAGRWHAFETASGVRPDDASANDPQGQRRPGRFTDVEVLPPFAAVARAAKELADLRAELAQDSKAPGIHGRINKARERLAAQILGVPDTEVQLNIDVADRVAGRINLTGNPGSGANTSGRHGPVRGQDPDFHAGQVTAIDIDADLIDKPERAQGTTFHEAQHLEDFNLAQLWVANYQTETKRLFVGKGPGRKPFMDWINEQVKKKRLTPAQGQLVVDEAFEATGTTEARANIRTFLLYFKAGQFDAAGKALTAYANALPPGRMYANPPAGSPVLVELQDELRAARRQAGKPEQARFDAALAAANTANPTTWFARLKLN